MGGTSSGSSGKGSSKRFVINRLSKRERRLMRAVVTSLSDDLLAPSYRRQPGDPKVKGHCFVATEACYHFFAKRAGYVPNVVRLSDKPGDTHWWLRHPDTRAIIDPTRAQVVDSFDYDLGRGKGYRTRGPSKRAKLLLTRAKRAMKAS